MMLAVEIGENLLMNGRYGEGLFRKTMKQQKY